MLISPQLDAQIGPMTQGHVVTDDGVELLYQLFEEGSPSSTVVFANGIGVRYPGAVEQINTLRREHRIICWDYRGMGQSVMPDPHLDVSMPRQAKDILTILDHLEIPQCLFIGWSMGVQVSLEAIRLDPGRVSGLVALMGSFGEPFRTSFPAPVSWAMEQMFGFLHHHPAIVQGALSLADAIPTATYRILSTLPFVGADVNREIFAANVHSVAGVDKALYTRTLLALADHNAGDILDQIRCPALIICGQLDRLTPPKVARHMAHSIKGAVYREVPQGTHFALIEQPRLVGSWINQFIEDAAVARAVQ